MFRADCRRFYLHARTSLWPMPARWSWTAARDPLRLAAFLEKKPFEPGRTIRSVPIQTGMAASALGRYASSPPGYIRQFADSP